MNQQPPLACKHCGRAAESGSVCSACKPTAPKQFSNTYAYRAADPVDPMYRTKRWTDCTKTMRAMNTICQVLENGVQCTRPSRLTHHKISPREDPSLFTNPGNLVAICAEHHSNDAGEMQGRSFVPTRWVFGITYQHQPGVTSDQVIGTPAWFAANKPKV